MTDLVQITAHDDGERVEKRVWCVSVIVTGSPATLCGGEFYGYGEGSATYKTKSVNRGGITCPECLRIVREIKAIRL